MAEIRFEGIKKQFKDIPVIKRLDLTIKDGEFFTFVGPSGCGKATLLNMIAGLEAATEGNIYFDNLPVNDLSPKERDVAMVFQSYALYPHMTVYENIAFPLRVGRRAELKRLHQDLKITSIYVTHDQAEALSLSERIAVLHEGEIRQCGTRGQVYMRPTKTHGNGFLRG